MTPRQTRSYRLDAVFSAIGSVALVALWASATWPFYIDAICVLLAFTLLVPLVRIVLAHAAVSLRDSARNSDNHTKPRP